VSLFPDPLGALLGAPVGRSRRVSSNEQPNWKDGNFDMTPLPPGATIELPLLEGPGYINHIWFTSHAGGVNELNALSLRIYWDGREEPGVEAPLGEFFAVGQGKPAAVESFQVQVSPTGSLTCYWRMPFAKSARMVIRNDNPDRTAGLYWQVDWVQLDALPGETPYFHAQYRQEYPAVGGRDYLLADIEGRGHYVGTVMSLTLAQDGWFGEGDDFFYIDGEEIPSLQGTGSEDYFNDAWGFRQRTGTWFGQPRWQGDDTGDSGVCYRWHVLDPVRFETSLRVAIEHKGNHLDDVSAWYIERPDFINSVAFWYQSGLPKRFGSLPGWPERCVPWDRQHLVRSFRLASPDGGKVSVRTEGFFGGRPVLSWAGAAAGASLTLPFTAAEAGRFAVRLTAHTGPRGGCFAVEIDGTPVAELDLRTPELDEQDLRLGVHDLTAGAHLLRFVAREANIELWVELVNLLRLPPPAERPVKGDGEAHFVRLGIGRAVYAYRLAYGELPDSLEALVASGIMPERYLRDENEVPLHCRRTDAGLLVEAPSWHREFFGLDARR